MKLFKLLGSVNGNLGRIVCSLAMLVAVHSAGIACWGKFYQPELPKELR